MPTLDRLGRRRRPGQHRGLRSLFPTLPADCQSRLLRVAMSTAAWARLDALIADSSSPTAPRALGALLEGWLSVGTAQPVASRIVRAEAETTTDWQAWQVRKELALLASIKQRGAPAPSLLH